MNHNPVFAKFSSVPCIGTGHHVFDFIGSATHSRYRKGWEAHAVPAGRSWTAPLPPANEHYFDWVATLESVDRASGTFRMAELGAGWAPWLVRAALACRQRPSIQKTELVAVEADETHHAWVVAHFADNALASDQHHWLRGAVAANSGTIRFPRITNPEENYGASTRAAMKGTDFVEVRAYTVPEVLGRFSGPVDFMHVDIQGAEYDALPPAMGLLKEQVKAIMVGTHLSDELHDELVKQFRAAGWTERMNYPRNRASTTEAGLITFGDGFLYFCNPDF